MGITKYEYDVGGWVAFSFSFVSFVCSILTLVILRRMRVWNGYMLLIFSMASSQMVYDISYLVRVSPGFEMCVVWHFLGIVGGLGSSLWTNCLSFVVLYVLLNTRSFNIFRRYMYFFCIATVVPITVGIMSIATVTNSLQNDDNRPSHYNECEFSGDTFASGVNAMYYWGRVVCICINLFAFLFASYHTKRKGFGAQQQRPHTSSVVFGKNQSIMITETQHLAVATLVSRMKYYPFAQIICRSGAAWNEFAGYQYSSFASTLMAAVCSPSLGILYFVIFLNMQPKAWEALYGILGLKWTGASKPLRMDEGSAQHPVGMQSNGQLSKLLKPSDVLYFDEEQLEEIIDDRSSSFMCQPEDLDGINATAFENPIRSSMLAPDL